MKGGSLVWASDRKESTCSAGDLGSSPGWEDHVAAHSSTLAWRIPWTEEPGKLTVHGVTESDTSKRLTHTSLVYSVCSF